MFHIYLSRYGLRPDPERHQSSFWVEPESSIPVKVEMRLQLNILLRKVEGIEYLFKNLQEVMYPVFWFEVSPVLSHPHERIKFVSTVHAK